MLKKILIHGRILGFMAVILLVIASCEDNYRLDNGLTSVEKNADGSIANEGMRTAAVPGNYVVETATNDGFTFTLTIDQTGAQDISHLIVQLVDCNGEFVTIDNYVSATVNGIDWPLTSTTGSGTGCTFDNDFVKFDNFNFEGGIVVVDFTLDVQATSGSFLIKAGQGCFEYEIEGLCVECEIEPVYYDLFAGQTILVGQLMVTNDEEYLYVTYQASEGQLFTETHLYVGTLEGLPVNKKGTPVPGHFPYKSTDEFGVSEVTFTIPLADLEDCYIIAAHAAMESEETAWSFGTEFASSRWGWYSEYCTQYCIELL